MLTNFSLGHYKRYQSRAPITLTISWFHNEDVMHLREEEKGDFDTYVFYNPTLIKGGNVYYFVSLDSKYHINTR